MSRLLHLNIDPDTETLPREFTDTLLAEAALTLKNWLVKNGAPPEAVTLSESIVFLNDYGWRCRHDRPSAIQLAMTGIVEDSVRAINAIVALGGEFHCNSGTSYPRKPKPFKAKPSN